MKKAILTILFSFLCIIFYAQERFYSLYDGWCINKVFQYDDDYITNGLIFSQAIDNNTMQINSVNLLGSQTDTFTYINDTIDGMSVYRGRAYLKRSDTLSIVGSIVTNSKDYTLSPFLLNYNICNGTIDTIFIYNHSTNADAINYFIDSTVNGFVIVGTYRYLSDNYFPYLLFTDNQGDTLKTRKYDFLPTDPIRRSVLPYQLLKLSDSGFLLSCQDEIGSILSGFPDKQRAWFLRLDSEGNEVWRKSTATEDTLCYRPFAFVLEDNNYLITWSDPYLDNEHNDNRDLWLADMDDNGVISNKRKVSDYIDGFENKKYYVNDYYQDSDYNIYLSGEIAYPNTGFLMKINSNGIPQWFREYDCFPENNIENRWTKIYGLTPTEDGGFIMGGEYMSSDCEMFPGGIQKGLVIKVDSCGCLEEGCNSDCISTYSKHDISASKADIFPNPANEWVTITIPTQAKNSNIQIFDIKGCEWVNTVINSENSTIEISSLPNGIYTVNIWSNGKLFTGKFVKE